MAMTNAVLLRHATGFRWQTHAGTIGSWRRESFLPVGAVGNIPTVDAIAAEYFTTRTAPMESNKVTVEPTGTGDVPGDDYDVGDTLDDPFSTPARVVSITYSLDELAEGGLDRAPELRTRAEDRAVRSGLALNYMIDAAGGRSGGGAPPVSTGTDIQTGPLGLHPGQSWSWNKGSPADMEEPWQVWEADRPCRLYEWSVTCDASNATGITRFALQLQGVDVLGGLFQLVLGPTDTYASQGVWGPARVRFGEHLGPRCSDYGGHTNGTLTMRLCDVV